MKETLERIIKSKVFFVCVLTVITIVIAGLFFKGYLNDLKNNNETETEETANNEETTTSKPKETESKENETEETTVNLRKYYEDIIKACIIEKPEKETDKTLFEIKIGNLTEVQGNIEKSFDDKELTKSDYDDLNTMINDLIDLYNKRIEEIENTTTTTAPTTSTEPITKPVIQPTTTEKEESTTKEEETTTSIVNQGDRTDESQNPYIGRKDESSNYIYNDDGSSNLENTIITDAYDNPDNMWLFIANISEIKDILNNNNTYIASFNAIGKYQDSKYKHWDIRDYYIKIRDSAQDNKLIKMYHVNDNFELVEGPIQEDIDAGVVFR